MLLIQQLRFRLEMYNDLIKASTGDYSKEISEIIGIIETYDVQQMTKKNIQDLLDTLKTYQDSIDADIKALFDFFNAHANKKVAKVVELIVADDMSKIPELFKEGVRHRLKFSNWKLNALIKDIQKRSSKVRSSSFFNVLYEKYASKLHLIFNQSESLDETDGSCNGFSSTLLDDFQKTGKVAGHKIFDEPTFLPTAKSRSQFHFDTNLLKFSRRSVQAFQSPWLFLATNRFSEDCVKIMDTQTENWEVFLNEFEQLKPRDGRLIHSKNHALLMLKDDESRMIFFDPNAGFFSFNNTKQDWSLASNFLADIFKYYLKNKKAHYFLDGNSQFSFYKISHHYLENIFSKRQQVIAHTCKLMAHLQNQALQDTQEEQNVFLEDIKSLILKEHQEFTKKCLNEINEEKRLIHKQTHSADLSKVANHLQKNKKSGMMSKIFLFPLKALFGLACIPFIVFGGLVLGAVWLFEKARSKFRPEPSNYLAFQAIERSLSNLTAIKTNPTLDALDLETTAIRRVVDAYLDLGKACQNLELSQTEKDYETAMPKVVMLDKTELQAIQLEFNYQKNKGLPLNTLYANYRLKAPLDYLDLAEHQPMSDPLKPNIVLKSCV